MIKGTIVLCLALVAVMLPAPAMARSSDLERRIRIMLNPRLDRSPVGRTAGLLVLLAGIALTATLAGLSLSAAGAQPAGPVGPTVAAPPSVAVPPSVEAALSIAPASITPPSATPRNGEPASQSVAVASPRPSGDDRQAGGQAGIAVVVTDQLARTVPNATVALSGEAAGVNAEGRTGQDGEFTASGLTAGVYQVSVSKPGFKKARLQMPLEAGKQAKARFVLALGSLQETVAISAAAGAPPATDPLPVPRRVGEPPVADPCAASQEGGCVQAPRKLVDAKPVYPASALRAGVSGTVIVHARLLADGMTGDVQAEFGSDADLALAAVEAIRVWQFSPVHLDGVPFPVDMTVTVKFEISR